MKWFRPQFVPALASLVLVTAGFLAFTAKKPQMLQPHVSRLSSSNIRVAAQLPAIDCTEVACMALTFDDGPDAAHTPKVLGILKSKQVRATFFVVGSHAVRHPDIIRRMHAEGHEIGNHSWNHANLTKLAPAAIAQQVRDTQVAVMDAGVPAPRWFRPPYGAMNPVVKAHANLPLALWNVDPEDWDKKDKVAIKEHVVSHAGKGRVVDMHDMHGPTAEALPLIIDELRPHYQLVTVSELFNAVPGIRGEFYGR